MDFESNAIAKVVRAEGGPPSSRGAPTECQIFLSCVSNEFRPYRELLTKDLSLPGIKVEVQEHFVQGSRTLLEKLDDYIQRCSAVIHLVGTATGSKPKENEVAALLKKYPDFSERLPNLARPMAESPHSISYTQWEVWLALYHRIRCYVYRAAPAAVRAPAFVEDKSQSALQEQHWQQLCEHGKDREVFRDEQELSRLVMRSLMASHIVPDSPWLDWDAWPTELTKDHEPAQDLLLRPTKPSGFRQAALSNLWQDLFTDSPAVLVVHFPADAERTVLILGLAIKKQGCIRPARIRGSVLAEATKKFESGLPADAVVIVDGSRVPLDEAGSFALALEDFIRIHGTGRQIVAVLPRVLLCAARLRNVIDRCSCCWEAEELFAAGRPLPNLSHLESTRWIPYAQEVLGRLLRANSPALVGAITRYLEERPPDASQPLRDWIISLAATLNRQGFLEPAYRLEAFARTFDAAGGEAESADCMPLFVDPPHVFGLVERVSDAPQIARRAILTCTKRSAQGNPFSAAEHAWALPRHAAQGLRYPSWLPLHLTDWPVNGLEQAVQEAFSNNKTLSVNALETHVLEAHAKLSVVATLESLPYLFSSPVFFFAESIPEEPSEWGTYLPAFLTENPQFGLLACWQDGPVPRQDNSFRRLFDGGIEVRIQPVSASLHTSEVETLAGCCDRPVGRAMHNSYLRLLAKNALADGADVRDWGRFDLLEAHVNRASRRLDKADRAELLEDWLPKFAGRKKRLNDHKDPPPRQYKHLRPDVLMPSNVVRFAHPLVEDYFAARYLNNRLNAEGAESVVALLCKRPGWQDRWSSVLGLTVCRLDDELLDKLIERLAAASPRLACQCLSDIPRRRAKTLSRVRKICHDLSQQLQVASTTPAHSFRAHLDGKIEDAAALNFHDPRIDLDAPLNMMVPTDRQGLLLCKYPVTNLEYAGFVNDDGYRQSQWWDEEGRAWLQKTNALEPAYWRHPHLNLANAPVVGVCLHEANAYCRWLTARHYASPELPKFRLPRISERDRLGGRIYTSSQLFSVAERLARLKDPDSADNILKEYLDDIRSLMKEEPCWQELTGPIEVHPGRSVGLLPANAWGCYDQFGHIWEWCATKGIEISKDGPLAWVKGGPFAGRTHTLWGGLGGRFDPSTRFHEVGFRLACELSSGLS